MEKIKINSSAEIIYCPCCEKYRPIKDGIYKAEVAENDSSLGNRQYGVSMCSYFVVICANCKGKIERGESIK